MARTRIGSAAYTNSLGWGQAVDRGFDCVEI
jgi:hypothetical protein